MKIAEKIAQLCDRRGLTQSRCEELAQLPGGRISKWLSGQGEPTARQALRLARVLEVPVDWLADDQTENPPPQPDPHGGLSEDQRVLLRVAGLMGVENAIRRLTEPPEIRTRGLRGQD